VLSYRSASWTEVKDGGGAACVSPQIVSPRDSTRTVTGSPPFDLIIGNANDVTLTFRGQSVDCPSRSPRTSQAWC
jgi:cytoskeleton protein RodZ